jgi:hypothetical protein
LNAVRFLFLTKSHLLAENLYQFFLSVPLGHIILKIIILILYLLLLLNFFFFLHFQIIFCFEAHLKVLWISELAVYLIHLFQIHLNICLSNIQPACKHFDIALFVEELCIFYNVLVHNLHLHIMNNHCNNQLGQFNSNNNNMKKYCFLESLKGGRNLDRTWLPSQAMENLQIQV